MCAGTLRTFDADSLANVMHRMESTATQIAAASSATATLKFRSEVAIPPVTNDEALTPAALPVFESVVGAQNVRALGLQTVAEDFSFYGKQVPALFFWIGITPPDRDPTTAALNHSASFYVDEAGLITGVRTLRALTAAFLNSSSR